MRNVKIESMLSRCESNAVPQGNRLNCAVALLRALCYELDQFADEHTELAANLNRTLSSMKAGQRSLTVGSYSTGGMYGQRSSYGSNNLTASSFNVDEVSQNRLDTLASIRERIREHNAKSETLTQYCKDFGKVRAELKQVKTLNGTQNDLVSILIVSEPGNRWRNCKTSYNSVERISGDAINRLHRSNCESFPVDRHKLNRKGSKPNRVSVKRGEWLVDHSFQSRDYKRHNERYDAAMLGTRSYFSKYCHVLGTEPNCELRRVLNLVQPALVNRFELNTYSRTSELVRMLLIVRRMIAIDPNIVRHWRALGKHTRTQHVTDNGTNGIVLERSAGCGSFIVGTRQYQVVRWLVLTTSGTKCYEYGIASTNDEQVDNVLTNIMTFHGTPDTDAPDIAIMQLQNRIASYYERLEYQTRYGYGSRSASESKEQRQQRERQESARYVRMIRNLDVVVLSDSYNVGNCIPGTKDFCDLLGISEKSISGRELARKWKNVAYVKNGQFLRVIDNMTKQRLERVRHETIASLAAETTRVAQHVSSGVNEDTLRGRDDVDDILSNSFGIIG